MFSMHPFHRRMLMQRQTAHPWVWVNPSAPDVPYAAVCLKGGGSYAGPADALIPFADELVNGATMMICERAEALRIALNGDIRD